MFDKELTRDGHLEFFGTVTFTKEALEKFIEALKKEDKR